LPLEKAREFINSVAIELDHQSISTAIQRLRACYSRLSQP
jgi:hypothetical protein